MRARPDLISMVHALDSYLRLILLLSQEGLQAVPRHETCHCVQIAHQYSSLHQLVNDEQLIDGSIPHLEKTQLKTAVYSF